MTTGATLHSAAHNLLQAGAAQVGALVLARTGLGADATSKPVTAVSGSKSQTLLKP